MKELEILEHFLTLNDLLFSIFFQGISLLKLASQIHNEVRVVKVCSSFIVSNSSSIPLQVTALAVRHSEMSGHLTLPVADSVETNNATIEVLPNGKHRFYSLLLFAQR